MNKIKNIVIAGTGPAAADMISGAVLAAMHSAEVIIGASRLTESLHSWGISTEGKQVIKEYRAANIAEIIRNSDASRFVVIVSGDPGIYSAAQAVREALKEYEPKVLPGISSVSYLCSAVGVSMEDAEIISAHGRQVNIASEVRRARKCCVLTDKNAGALLAILADYGLGQVRVHIGCRLSFQDESIISGTAEELKGAEYPVPAVLLIINDNAGRRYCCGLPDSAFKRGRVPMTKRAVRAMSMSMLSPQPDSIIYDIGAGTGSVSVEAALAAWRGTVYAIEHKPEAIELIRANSRSFSADNIVVVEGRAPDVLENLPAPDIVFIGGSGGNLGGILASLTEKSRNAHRPFRLVMNAVTLETIAEAVGQLESIGFSDIEYTQISAAVSHRAGAYNLMQSENPILVICACFNIKK